MSLRSPLLALLVLLLGALPAVPTPASAQGDDEDFDLEGIEDDDEEGEKLDEELEVDDEATYKAYKEELRGEPAEEEIDAWQRYLDIYPKSLYRMEIERRIQALEEQSYNELLQEELEAEETGVDAKEAEMDLRDLALLGINANTRRHIEVGVLWGFPAWINYDVNFEWAFHRQFSVWGGLRHVARSEPALGLGVQIGAKGALVKDVRTGIILSGNFAFEANFNQNDQFHVAIQPGINFGWIISKRVQLQTSLQFWMRLNNFHSKLLWDIQAVVMPTDVVGIYVQSAQKHSLYTRPSGGDAVYFGFHQVGVGVKIRPTTAPLEVTVGVNTPYALRLWQDYRYIGIHAGVSIFLDKKK